MTFTSTTRAAFAATAISLFAIGTANAGAIYTPTIFKGDSDQIVCIATNTTNATIHVTVKIIGTAGNATTTCDVEPNDAGGCQAFRNGDGGYCKISVNALTNAEVAANLRGVLFGRKTMAPFAIQQVVQAQ